jgi:hypothetical protein
MTCGPYPSWIQSINTIEDAYEHLRFACNRLEELLEKSDPETKQTKRCDKAVTVMKVGFKILKKAIGYTKSEIKEAA